VADAIEEVAGRATAAERRLQDERADDRALLGVELASSEADLGEGVLTRTVGDPDLPAHAAP
jgi:hypothetical protein